MTTTLQQPVTARDLLLLPDVGEHVDTLAAALHDRGALDDLISGAHGLTAPVGRAVEREVASVVSGFLALDLFDLVAGGWRRHTALRQAARRTRDEPGSEEVVALAKHRITSVHRPKVDVLVDGSRIGTLDVDLKVVFDLEGLVGVVRQARLIAVRAGSCMVTGSLAVQRIALAQQSGRISLGPTVELRHGVRLLPDPDPQSDPGSQR
ncbi:hypothetical protein [Kitasatospora sp. NPDC007106]|uniref:hypothetical protein n=1 Tax=Kitasatospora sp. NPDC007106 TaxID=3156914 RepID=UPI0033EC58B2